MLGNKEDAVRVMGEVNELLWMCESCEEQALELMKVANCVFARDAFFELIGRYHIFVSHTKILKSLKEQVDDPPNALQVVTLEAVVRELKVDFSRLATILHEANRRIDQDEIDFEAAEVIHELLEAVAFDVIDYDDFEAVLEAVYFIAEPSTNSCEDEDEDDDDMYGTLTVLKIHTFKTKREAYAYALAHGISKNQVWTLYDK